MNKTRIEWADYTWNPVVGCRRGCDYCYARRFAERGLGEYGVFEKGQRFQPRFFPERLLLPQRIKKSSRIFVCSMGELFGPWVSEDWQEEVIAAARWADWHTFMFLTKYPEALPQFNPWPDNCWVGATATNRQELETASIKLSDVEAPARYVSLEPLLAPINPWDLIPLDWIIIGAQTGPGARAPEARWIEEVIAQANAQGIPLFLKDNLRWPEKRQEWPEGARL